MRLVTRLAALRRVMVHGTWYMVQDTGRLAALRRVMVHGTWYMVQDTGRLAALRRVVHGLEGRAVDAHGTWYMVQGTRYRIQGAWVHAADAQARSVDIFRR